MVDALRASCLPYRAAYDAQQLPPVPDRLMQQVSTYAQLAQSAQSRSADVQPPRSRAALRLGSAMAASFAFRGGSGGLSVAVAGALHGAGLSSMPLVLAEAVRPQQFNGNQDGLQATAATAPT
jgi:hypothetical protein